MKTKWIVTIIVALVVVLAAGLATAVWYLNGQNAAQAQGPQWNAPQGQTGGWGMMGDYYGDIANPGAGMPQGPVNNWGPMGMMGRYYGDGAWGMPCEDGYAAPNAAGQALTIDQALEAVEQYVARRGYTNLEVEEVMEFSRNFYAIVKETATGIGAMELLVDKYTGVVGPEYGPNMMWNAKYGMGGMGGGMMGGGASGAMTVPPAEALQIAQRWLDTYRPGVVAESHADPFYGYYTIHTLSNGAISGMLSVHGATGQVWYHNWHGDFIQMVGE